MCDFYVCVAASCNMNVCLQYLRQNSQLTRLCWFLGDANDRKEIENLVNNLRVEMGLLVSSSQLVA